MKKLLVVLVALGILLAAVSVVHAQETSNIWLAFPGTYTVRETDNVEMALGWSACNKGLAKQYIKAVNMEFKLDGETFYETSEPSPYWTLGPLTDSIWYSYVAPLDTCIANPYPHEKQHAFGEFYYTIPSELLEAGNTYILSWYSTLDHPVTDGMDNLEPFGVVDIYSEPEYYEYTIIVTE